MKVIWSPLAVEQVSDIASYIALDKPSSAKQWADKIFESVDILSDFPESGRKVPEIDRYEIREIVPDNYRVIYKIEEKQVLILIVKSYRQLLKPEEI